jgi:hypothetical protein
MIREEMVPEQIVVELRPETSIETVRFLRHSLPSDNAQSAELQKLFGDLPIVRIAPVYQCTDEEISSDRYGFARTFKLTLSPEVPTETALAKLKSHPYIKSAKPSVFRRAS